MIFIVLLLYSLFFDQTFASTTNPFIVFIKEIFGNAFLIIVLGPAVIFIYNSILLKIKRSHDINLKGLWLLLYFIPIIGFVFELVLCFASGNKSENKFGPPPEKASRFEYIMALTNMLFVITISFLQF